MQAKKSDTRQMKHALSQPLLMSNLLLSTFLLQVLLNEQELSNLLVKEHLLLELACKTAAVKCVD